jgi:hypothetical protein
MSRSPRGAHDPAAGARDGAGALFMTRETRLAARCVAGEMVILSADDSSLYVLNEVATRLWQSADGTVPLHEIVERVICAEYEVDRETGLRDAEGFARELASHGILRLSSTPAAAPTETE